MSNIDTTQSLPVPIDPPPSVAKFARANAPIVPPGSVTGRSLTFVIAIMSFLASLTAGGVYLTFNAAVAWTNNITQEITVHVQGLPGVAPEAMDAKIADIVKFLRDQNGIKQASAYTREQSLKLVEPWIGRSEILKSFPVPRLIAVEVDRDSPPEIPMVKKVLEAKFPGAILDDHGLWRGEFHRFTRFIELGGVGMLALMAAATAAVIIAAATSALASNREIVSVLNLVGAEERFIARQFEMHFLWVGIKAGVFGAGLAALSFFTLSRLTGNIGVSAAAEAELRRLVGAGTLDAGGYAVLVVVVIVVATICKMTSRYGVRRILNQQNA